MALLSAIALLGLAPAANCNSPAPDTLFKEFEQLFNRSYASAEERAYRLSVFTENLGNIQNFASTDSSAEYSHLTIFADWTVEEFTSRNTLQPASISGHSSFATPLSTADLPEAWDWREKGAVNAIKNQFSCGSCWAFSTVANVEGVNFVKTGKLVSLSEQELVDCDKATGNEGCNGGLPSDAFKDMIANNIGLESESAYPYTGRGGTCVAEKAKEQVFVSNWTQISTDEDQIAAALVKYGPLSIGINAGPMQWYRGGVANPWKILCNPARLDHGVAIVGFGVDNGKKYWTIRNSWGVNWGEQGYYRIIRGKGSCGLNTMVTTAFVGEAQPVLVV